MKRLDPLVRLRLQRGVEHLHQLGPRAIGCLPAALELLGEFEQRITPAMLHATGGDQSAPWLRVVPR